MVWSPLRCQAYTHDVPWPLPPSVGIVIFIGIESGCVGAGVPNAAEGRHHAGHVSLCAGSMIALCDQPHCWSGDTATCGACSYQ